MDIGGPPLPFGYQFQPTQQDIVHLLRLKTSDPAFVTHYVGQRPLYAPNASFDFIQDFAAYHFGSELHFFTPLANGSPDADRVVANGSWKFECANEIHTTDGGGVFAFKKIFTFCDTDDKPMGLIMYEFTLAAQQAWALCLIKRFKSPATTTLQSHRPSPITFIPSAATLKRQRAAALKRQQMVR